jgi:hypothetical protein
MDQLDKAFEDWLERKYLGSDADKILTEGMQTSRYSIEVNYRTKIQEVVDAFAKMTLGYISAGMKNCGYHCKVVYNNKPFRVLVSTRNWDDGEWVGCVVFDHKTGEFWIAEGSYNKDRKTVTIHSRKKCPADSAAEVVRELRNVMEKLKREKPRGSNSLEPAELKRGPKPTHLKKLSKTSGPWKPKLKKPI